MLDESFLLWKGNVYSFQPQYGDDIHHEAGDQWEGQMAAIDEIVIQVSECGVCEGSLECSRMLGNVRKGASSNLTRRPQRNSPLGL